MAKQDSLVMDMHDTVTKHRAFISEWIEVWDYASDMNFKGFVGGLAGHKSLFVFFKPIMVGKDLKPG